MLCNLIIVPLFSCKCMCIDNHLIDKIKISQTVRRRCIKHDVTELFASVHDSYKENLSDKKGVFGDSFHGNVRNYKGTIDAFEVDV